CHAAAALRCFPSSDFCQFAAHGVDDGFVIRLAENSGAGHEGIGASLCCGGNIVDLDAAVDFQQDLASRFVDQFAHGLDLVQRVRNEGLAAEAGVHRHQQDDVELVHHVFQIMQR